MSPVSPASGRPERGWQVFSAATLVLALVALASLLAVLFTAWAGGTAWAGFNFIAELGLPIAFLMMGASIVHAVARRRRL